MEPDIPATPKELNPRPWPAGDDALSRLMREKDWTATAAGPVSGWPQSLKSVLDMMLPTEAQIVLFWGPGYLAFYNEAYAPSIGEKHPDALGQPAHLYWSELWDDLRPLLDGVRTTGKTLTARDRPFQINRHGYLEEVFFDISYSAIRDESGDVAGVMCIVSETTARVMAARTLQESQAQLKEASERIELALSAGAVLGTWVWDVANDRITGDERFARTFDLDTAALHDGVPLSQAKQSIHADDIPHVESAITAAMQRGGPYSVEYRVRQSDGSWRWIEANGRVELGADGAPKRFPGVLIDIDRRKRADLQREADRSARQKAESELGDVQGHLRMAQAAGGIGVFMLDIVNNKLSVSGEFCRMFGLPPVETMSAAIPETLVQEGSVSRVATREDGSAALNVEYRIRRADDGAERWIARRAEFLRDTEGRPVTMRGVVQDVTERKAVEESLRTRQIELAQLNAELEARVEERAAALRDAEARLRQSSKMEALGQLTGGIAHDFNNLLQGITGSLEILKRRLANGRTDDADRFMNSATSSAQRAAALIHRLLAFSRRQSLDTKAIDAGALVRSMEDLLRRTIGEHIALEVNVAPDTWPALTDENQLESAILNLAVNARDAMPHGGRLTISTGNGQLDLDYTRRHEGLAPGDYTVVTVSDTGAGMAPDVLAKAFEPFFTTKPIGQGTGLGLSMIYGFAQQSGGHVRIDSAPGRGTSVHLYLPRHHTAVQAEPSGAFTDLPQGSGEVVLVVEDDNVVRLLALDVLQELGYATLEAADGLAALPVLQSDARIDLLVTDVGLPGMNGRQVAEVARQHRPGLSVLFMTGYAEKATQRSEFLAPGMEMIAKPFSIDELAVRIQQILRREE